VRCPRCGNENSASNRFCGMCGTSLLQAPSPIPAGPPAKGPAAVPAVGTIAGPAASLTARPVASPAPPTAPAAGTVPSAAPATAPAQRAAAAPAEEARSMSGPIISGPSFLGLNQPAPAPRRRGPLSIDPHAGPSSGNLDYLLEDEEGAKGGRAWKFFLLVIALALAAGFGYLRWKNQGLPWLGSGANKPSAAAQNSGAPGISPPAAASSSSASAPEAAAPSQPSPTSAPSAPDAAGTSPSSANPSPANTASANPSSANTASANSAAGPAAGGAQPGAAADAGGSGGTGGSSSAAAQPPAGKDAVAPAGTSAPATTARPKPAARPRAVTPARTADPVAEAQKYIYGKRVRQDCDRGLRLLKPAADQANPKAMIEMGALYSAGLCTPRDLPTAYRWFALALRKEPDNQSVQADLQKLWGEMTQPERQLAIRLSQ